MLKNVLDTEKLLAKYFHKQFLIRRKLLVIQSSSYFWPCVRTKLSLVNHYLYIYYTSLGSCPTKLSEYENMKIKTRLKKKR